MAHSTGSKSPTHATQNKKRNYEEETSATRKAEKTQSDDDSHSPKRKRVMGPTLPPPNAMTASPTLSAEESSSDDDFGPALPPTGDGSVEIDNQVPAQHSDETEVKDAPGNTKTREAWMLAPPSSDSWSSRVDPTKLRNRKFTSGKGAKAPSQGNDIASSLWTETPEEKRKRLQDEMMGTSKSATGSTVSAADSKAADKTRSTDEKIREYNKSNRNVSLYAEHSQSNTKEEEDDPSKRAFDKEKDIRGGSTIGHAKRKELLSKAADFGSRFSKGKYL